MRKDTLAKKVLCALLAAGMVGITGSALANSIGTVEIDGVPKTVSHEGTFTIGSDGSNVKIFNDQDKASIHYGLYSALYINSSSDKGTIVGKNIDFYSKTDCGIIVNNGASINIGNASTEKVSIDSSDDGIRSINQGHTTINAKEVNINCRAESGSAAIWLQNGTDDVVAPANATSLTINADKINLTGKGIGISIFSNSKLDINGDVLILSNNRAIQTRGNSTININTDGKHKTVLKGDIAFTSPRKLGEADTSSRIINSNIDINLTGADSSWTGRAYQKYNDSESVDLTAPDYYGDVTGFKMNFSDGAVWNMTGDSFINNLTASDNASINVQKGVKNFNAGDITLNKGILDLKGDGQRLNVVSLKGSEGTVKTDSVTNKVLIDNKAADTKLNVEGSSKITDEIASGEATLQQLANVVANANEENTSLADTVKSAANEVIGGYYAEVGKDGKIVAGSEKIVENSINRAISDMAAISLMTWRAENNDMNKRLGELRDSKGEHGAWARMARGESKYGAQNVKNQYNYYQVGYDEKLSVNPNWTVGVALTRTEGSSSFRDGSGENKHTGVALYGSYLNDDGSFLDLIAKYARMDNDFKGHAGVGNGDYETNGYSLSAEYGKRFTKDNGFWLEPQVELTYGKVGSASYLTSNGVKVYQEGMDSLVGRLGFALGKNIKQGNVYVRASYLYDFDGKAKATMLKGTQKPYSFEQELGGGWWELGVGTNLNLSAATHLYFDVEKTYGGNVATPWQWNAGVRWSF